MPITVDKTQDYLVWDNTQTISYRSVSRSDRAEFDILDLLELFSPFVGQASEFSITYAKHRPLSFNELMADNGAYTSQDTVWTFPVATSKALTNALAMKRGDKLTDEDGIEWTVIGATLGKNRNTWVLTCRNLVIVEDLRDTITIVRPAITVGDANEPIFDYGAGATILADGIAARVQPISYDRQIQNEKEDIHRKHQIVIGERMTLQANDRILWDGNVLQFDEVSGEDRLGLLTVISATEHL
jgi:hypothetical protein